MGKSLRGLGVELLIHVEVDENGILEREEICVGSERGRL